jgi:hypothetical protein
MKGEEDQENVLTQKRDNPLNFSPFGGREAKGTFPHRKVDLATLNFSPITGK